MFFFVVLFLFLVGWVDRCALVPPSSPDKVADKDTAQGVRGALRSRLAGKLSDKGRGKVRVDRVTHGHRRFVTVGALVGMFVGTRRACTSAMCDVEGNREPVRGNRWSVRGNCATREINSGATLRATLRAIATTTPARVEVAR